MLTALEVSVIAAVGGGVSVLVGLSGLGPALKSFGRSRAGTEPSQTPEGPRRRRLAVATAALLIGAGSALLGAGIVGPLRTLSDHLAFATRAQAQIALFQQMSTSLAGEQRTHLESICRSQAELKQTQAELLALRKQSDAQTAMIISLVRQIALSQTEVVQRSRLNDPERRDPKTLSHYEGRVSSQNGEDGIIAEIFRRIGTTNRYFVEFGASNGVENNTALLLREGWGGLWMEADSTMANQAKEIHRQEIEDGALTVLQAFITAENIEDLFRQGEVPEEFDLLSIDIDRNDYHVWNKITHYRPRVVVVEYNAGILPSVSWHVPYDPKAFGWTNVGNGNGASLKALEELGASKGYRLVGCNLAGVNAFFVREDLVGDHFSGPYTAENHFEPFRFPYLTR